MLGRLCDALACHAVHLKEAQQADERVLGGRKLGTIEKETLEDGHRVVREDFLLARTLNQEGAHGIRQSGASCVIPKVHREARASMLEFRGQKYGEEVEPLVKAGARLVASRAAEWVTVTLEKMPRLSDEVRHEICQRHLRSLKSCSDGTLLDVCLEDGVMQGALLLNQIGSLLGC